MHHLEQTSTLKQRFWQYHQEIKELEYLDINSFMNVALDLKLFVKELELHPENHYRANVNLNWTLDKIQDSANFDFSEFEWLTEDLIINLEVAYWHRFGEDPINSSVVF